MAELDYDTEKKNTLKMVDELKADIKNYDGILADIKSKLKSDKNGSTLGSIDIADLISLAKNIESKTGSLNDRIIAMKNVLLISSRKFSEAEILRKLESIRSIIKNKYPVYEYTTIVTKEALHSFEICTKSGFMGRVKNVQAEILLAYNLENQLKIVVKLLKGATIADLQADMIKLIRDEFGQNPELEPTDSSMLGFVL